MKDNRCRKDESQTISLLSSLNACYLCSKNSVEIKIAMKNHNAVEMHGLGKAVRVIERQNIPKIIWKWIYVSRVSLDVSWVQIVNYIKTNLPDIDEKCFKVHMLVERDQSPEKLSYISFHVACVELMYNKLCDPSFWPSHVMIGDFVERPCKKSGSNLNHTWSYSEKSSLVSWG